MVSLVSAFRSPSHGLKALQTLVKSGVDISRILDDGRTYLALAAELSRDTRVLQYLYDNGCAPHLNQQDKWGWTPLHYCVFVESSSLHNIQTSKLRFLLTKGANLETKAGENQRIPIPILDSDGFTPVDLSNYLEKGRPTGVTALLRSYVRDEDIFYDAVESQGAAPVAA
ncbi:hypothetical protein GGR58DRAFT_527274 [Xylaria digitata]|nr:hypothetical protein GGR58DRAFT_527274 [Xylaria digitata]